MDETIIHLAWQGPFSFSDAILRSDRRTDYGIYQVCGPHAAYGTDALLYIGRAQKQTFGVRLQQEGWQGWQKANGTARFYLAQLHGITTPDFKTWDEQIARAEKLLIVSHRPAHNSKDLYQGNDERIKTLHILNWGERGKLLPEVSGLRWSSYLSQTAEHKPYGSHEEVAIEQVREAPEGIPEDIDTPF